MLHALILSLALVTASAPPAPSQAASIDPGPAQCADATLTALTSPVLTAGGDIGALDHCFVSVDCGGGQSVSCSGHNDCQGVPRDCANGEQGRVVCDGVAKLCPACDCTEGDFRTVPTGDCCNCFDAGGELVEIQECINGTWETTGGICRRNSMCPICQ